MGIFKYLFRNKQRSISSSSLNRDPDLLLKKATALKSDGDLDAAIAHLRMAYEEVAKTSISYSVKTFLRLPLYLQIAGRRDEAWQEFNNLLVCGFPNQIQSKEIIPMDQCMIYDKMRLFLQREGRNHEAVKCGVFSYLSMLKGLFFQKRKKELRDCKDTRSIEAEVNSLLKKAKITGLSERIVEIIEEEIKNLPDINIAKIGKRISEVMELNRVSPLV